jgi:archaellum component FlaC|tara:strand:+ start:677 stop:922 length:246 start_codon:yes stop_codon:yes gene_type:complete
MELLSPYIVWNALITLVLAPIWFQIRQNASELKRQDILLNKTREEIAKEYVTKNELKDDMNAIMDRIDKIGEKLDKLFEVK